ncbi:MAG TPA: hypothetical protein ENI05_11145 [Porticoccus sp.]|nr:hypothetical protein [Porticoccus sp.]
MSVDQAFNYKKISDSISTAGLLNEEQLNVLGTEGYEVVINLLPQESEYAIQSESSIVAAQGIHYEYIPVDFASPLESDYQNFSEVISAHSGKKLMVHCAANYRVSAFYAIYAFNKLGWSKPQVYDFISAIWDLGEHPVWEEFVSTMVNAKNG